MAHEKTSGPQFVTGQELREVVDFRGATRALSDALEQGLDPADDLARLSEPLSHGTMLLMPSDNGSFAGIKVLTMTPANPARGLDLIQGAYLLFDGDTLALTHVIDGSALTDLRTPATSMTALAPALTRFEHPLRVVVFGAGHQGRAHAAALRQLARERPEWQQIESVVAVVRNPDSVEVGGAFSAAVAAGSAEVEALLREADIVLCATPASEPLFDSAVLRDDVLVAAVGSHTPDSRELDGELMGRAQVVVEDRASALREGGDVILAIEEGKLSAQDLIPLADVVTGRHSLDPIQPYVFKGSGMPWQDLVVASAYAKSAGC